MSPQLCVGRSFVEKIVDAPSLEQSVEVVVSVPRVRGLVAEAVVSTLHDVGHLCCLESLRIHISRRSLKRLKQKHATGDSSATRIPTVFCEITKIMEHGPAPYFNQCSLIQRGAWAQAHS